jgi:orotidine-5'-phosphate decarboxylase
MSNRQSPKIFTALDFSDPESAWSMYQRLKPLNPYFKIGLELFAQLGVEGVRRYSDDGAKIFLDLKFHDIPNTVKQAIMQVNKTGAVLTNIHIAGGEAMSRAALSALPSGHGPKLIIFSIM